jgi:hypothetical protein
LPPSRDIAADEDGRCRQCDGTLDGTEQHYEINGTRVWLHPECHRFFMAEHTATGERQ